MFQFNKDFEIQKKILQDSFEEDKNQNESLQKKYASVTSTVFNDINNKLIESKVMCFIN